MKKKVRILYGYRSAATDEQYLAPGVHSVEESLAEYLIENGHAAIMEPPRRRGRPPTPKLTSESETA